MRHLLASLLSLTLLAGWSGHALAHASLSKAQPAENAVVSPAPTAVQLWFSRNIEPAFSTVQVVDQGGKDVQQGKAAVNANDGKLLEVALPPLPAGTYKVVWRIVAMDGHKAKGEYSFTVK